MIRLRQKDVDRFWAKVDVCGPDDCWEWQAGILKYGYGEFWLKGGMIGAHRVAYVLGKSKQPGKLSVCHSCDNRKCCNPRHLWLGTIRDNNQDRDTKGRHVSCPGEKHGMHILTGAEVKEIKNALKNYSQGMCKELGQRYGVSIQTVSNIKCSKSWRHIHA